jgi:DNA-binding Xre family transcriptional regulator
MARNPENALDYSPQLQQLMQRVGINSYRQLSEQASVSRWAINLLRQGQVERLRVEVLLQLSEVLDMSVAELLATFAGNDIQLSATSSPQGNADVETLQREYARLQQQMVQQEEEVRRRVQGDAIAILESWMLQWPTAAHAVTQNPDLPASRLLPLTKPLDALIQSWGIVPIGTIGETVPFDPQVHRPRNGNPQPGELVRIRNVGYRQGEKLLYRAAVSPADGS